MPNSVITLIGLILVAVLFILDLVMGSVYIPASDILDILWGEESKKSWEYIIVHFRLPKAFTAILTGAGISVAGLQMQTLFRNPLAGPSVLGITHGASLGVAVFVLSSSLLMGGSVANLQESTGSWGLILFAILGSLLVLFFVLLASARLSDSTSVLIVGMMFGFITGALVSVLQFFSDPELIQNFLIWSFGSLSGVAWAQLKIVAPIIALSLLFSSALAKQMNALLLGDNYAIGVGVNVKQIRIMLIVATSVLAGTLTAFIGPIAFVGIAVPHLARLLFKSSNHKIIIPATMLCGAIVLLACDIISQVPGSQTTLPINSITAMFGAPVIISIILKRKKMKGAFSE